MKKLLVLMALSLASAASSFADEGKNRALECSSADSTIRITRSLKGYPVFRFAGMELDIRPLKFTWTNVQNISTIQPSKTTPGVEIFVGNVLIEKENGESLSGNDLDLTAVKAVLLCRASSK